MRLLCPEETFEVVGRFGMQPAAANEAYGQTLLPLDPRSMDELQRIEARADLDCANVSALLLRIIGWGGFSGARLLWVSSTFSVYPDVSRLYYGLLARFGDSQSLMDRQAILFDGLGGDIYDVFADESIREEVETLVSALSVILLGSWDAFLLSEASGSFVEFWEGNILFYTSRKDAASEAEAIIAEFELPAGMR